MEQPGMKVGAHFMGLVAYARAVGAPSAAAALEIAELVYVKWHDDQVTMESLELVYAEIEKTVTEWNA